MFYFILVYKKKKQCWRIVVGACPVFATGIHSQWIRNLEGRLLKVNLPQELELNQVDHLEGEQYSQYPMEGNSRGYMSMRDYKDQWMSVPSYMVPPQYASLSQPQPPQPISPVEQAILDLTKLVGDAVEEQNKFNAQLRKKIHIVENPLKQKLDWFQSEVSQEFDILQQSISHQGEENPKDECLIETILGEQAQLQPQEELKVELVEAPPEELQDAPESGVTFWPWKKEEQISALIT